MKLSLTVRGGAPVLSRTTKVVANSTLRSSLPALSQWDRTRWTAVPAISANGWRTVVSGGDIQPREWDVIEADKAQLRGDLHPGQARRFQYAHGLDVAADEYPVGRSSIESIDVVLKAASTWKSPQRIRSGSTGRPAASIAER